MAKTDIQNKGISELYAMHKKNEEIALKNLDIAKAQLKTTETAQFFAESLSSLGTLFLTNKQEIDTMIQNNVKSEIESRERIEMQRMKLDTYLLIASYVVPLLLISLFAFTSYLGIDNTVLEILIVIALVSTLKGDTLSGIIKKVVK